MKEGQSLLGEILEGDPLTDREIELLYLMAQGKTAKTAGEELFLSTDTVKGYNKRIVAKLGAKNMVNAVVLAIGTGVIDIGRIMDEREN